MNSLIWHPRLNWLRTKRYGLAGNARLARGVSDLFAKVLVDKGKHHRAD